MRTAWCTAADLDGRPAARAYSSSTATSSSGRLTLSFIPKYYRGSTGTAIGVPRCCRHGATRLSSQVLDSSERAQGRMPMPRRGNLLRDSCSSKLFVKAAAILRKPNREHDVYGAGHGGASSFDAIVNRNSDDVVGGVNLGQCRSSRGHNGMVFVNNATIAHRKLYSHSYGTAGQAGPVLFEISRACFKQNREMALALI
jgi:hypothetical protein